MDKQSKFIPVKKKKAQKKKYTLYLIMCIFGLLFLILLFPAVSDYFQAQLMIRYVFPILITLTVAIFVLNILLWRSIIKIKFYDTNKKRKK